MRKLRILSQDAMDTLQEQVPDHRARYEYGHFLDLESTNGWAIDVSSVSIDDAALAKLDSSPTSPEIEVRNSLIVYHALGGLTPAIAREGRVWVRLTHIECLEYSRSRWLQRKSEEALDKAVLAHLFGTGLTSIRDDNAIGRLWWNGKIAKMSAGNGDHEQTLRVILKSADIRSGFIERSNTTSRPKLAHGIIRLMLGEAWVTADADNFREFMKVLNRNGGGILFEALDDCDIDRFLADTVTIAMKHRNA